MEYYFEIEIEPVAWQSVRHGKNSFYKPQKIKDYQNKIALEVKKQLPKDFKILTGKIEVLFLHFRYCTKNNELKNTPKTTKPDLDNLEKPFYDSLKGILYKDDSQIYCKSDIYKAYTMFDEPSVIKFKINCKN